MRSHRLQSRSNSLSHHQRGVALLVMLIILIIGITAILLRSLSTAALRNERDKITADALAQAKEALIGYATSIALTPSGPKRPGDLPCPDNHPLGDVNEGSPSTPCDGNALGRLPWKKLGLPDLRDSSGERLWYAVSTNFKDSTRIGTLNSDTSGTITIRDSSGSLVNDGSALSGVVAIVIAPGEPLVRYDSLQQIRIPANYINPMHYLDCSGNTATPGVCNIEDNAAFTNSSATDGFIHGPVKIKDSNNNLVTIVNDQLITITQDNIMQTVQKRVAAEVKQCLNEYASPTNGGVGRYPWTAELNLALPPNYSDTSNILFGRVPDTPFTNTCGNSGGINCNTTPVGGMSTNWTGNCNINSSSGWWLNWKEIIFYGLADAYKPVNPLAPPACGTCLSVNPPSATADKKFAVIVAGKQLIGQTRILNTDKSTRGNYLEAPNICCTTSFTQQPLSTTFNDTVVFQ